MRGCKRAGRGGGGGSSQSIHLEVTRGHCTMKSTGQFYFQGGDVALSGIQSPSFAVPKVTDCGSPWNRGCSPAYTGISVYSHKPIIHVLCSELLVTRHTGSIYEACPIQRKITSVSTRETGNFGIRIP